MRRCLICGWLPWLLGRKRHDALHRLLGSLERIEMELGFQPGYWRQP